MKIRKNAAPGGCAPAKSAKLLPMPIRLCPACLAANGLDSLTCSSCGTSLPADPPQATGHPCPACGPATLLSERFLGSLQTEACDACSGLFLSRKAVLHAYADLGKSHDRGAGLAPSAPDPVVRYRPCPTCGKRMQRRLLGTGTGVVLDVCEHGTWFDRGELERAVQFARSGGLSQQTRTDAERDLARARAERQTAARPTASVYGWEWALVDILESVLWLGM